MAIFSFEEAVKKAGVKPTEVTTVGVSGTPAFDEAQKKSYGTRVLSGIKEDANKRLDAFDRIKSREDVSQPEKVFQAGGQVAGFAAKSIETATEEIPGAKQVIGAIGSGINWLANSAPIKAIGDQIGGTQAVQEAVRLYDTDSSFKDTVDAAANIVRLGADVDAVMSTPAMAKNVFDKVKSKVLPTPKTAPPTPPPPVGPVGEASSGIVGGVTKDIIPTADRMVNYHVTRALDLTQGDIKNIRLSTGNEVGEFVAKENLIGVNKADTVTKIHDFYQKNYDAVRSELQKVTTAYEPVNVPRYTEALGEIKKQIADVPGLQQANAEVDALLQKTTVTLEDVQKVKELMDDHFNLYKATGDVKEGVAKSGLTNIRQDIRKFIEDEVKAATGADIQTLNNNVQTARSLEDAINVRSTRGLTRANITPTDAVLFMTGTAVGTPLTGFMAVFIKKLINSPTLQLRFAKWLDGLTDAQRIKAQSEIRAGKIPPEIEVKTPDLDSVEVKNIPDSIPRKPPNKQSGAINFGAAAKGLAPEDALKDYLIEELPKSAGTEKNINLDLLVEADDFVEFLKDIKNPTMAELNRGLELLKLQDKNVESIIEIINKPTTYEQLRDTLGRFKSKS